MLWADCAWLTPHKDHSVEDATGELGSVIEWPLSVPVLQSRPSHTYSNEVTPPNSVTSGGLNISKPPQRVKGLFQLTAFMSHFIAEGSQGRYLLG